MPIKINNFTNLSTIPQKTTAGFSQTPKNYLYNNHVLQESRQFFGGYK